MRPVAFGEALAAGTRLTLFSDDKPDRFFTVIKFWMDTTSGVALELKTGVPTSQVEDEEGRTHLLIHLPIEEEEEHRWCLWRPDHAGFDSRSIFEGALVEEKRSRSNGRARNASALADADGSNGVLVCWITAPFANCTPLVAELGILAAVRMRYLPFTIASKRRLIRRSPINAGLSAAVSCHSFRATGITVYLQNKGTLETAQKIAAHESPRTTKL